MITVTHCPKLGLYLASVQRASDPVEFNYTADHHIAGKDDCIAYSRKEQIRFKTTHVLAVADTPHEAEIQAKLKLARAIGGPGAFIANPPIKWGQP